LLIAAILCFMPGCGPTAQKPAAAQPSEKASPQAQKPFDVLHPLTFGEKNGRLAVVDCTERIVEIPFMHRHLPNPFRGRVLDVGYLESEGIFQVASLGFDTWGIDIRPPAVAFPGVHFIQGDVIQYPFEPHSFDVVTAISTVEHIGLHAYGNVEADPQGDLHALQAVQHALKPSGRLILTVPFGKLGMAEWYRVYDHKALLALLQDSGFRIEAADYWIKRGDVSWVPTPWKEAEKVDSVTPGPLPLGVVGVVARPARR
jgi:SAM-dependent methyltransferase